MFRYQIFIRFFTKYAWVKSLKDKKAKIVPHDVTEIVNRSKLIKEEIFTRGICRNGWMIMIF